MNGGWVRTDESWFEDDATEALGSDAAMLHLSGLAYCARQLNDGHLSRRALRHLWPVEDIEASIDKLMKANLWLPTDDGYLIATWTKHILKADEVERRKKLCQVTSERYRQCKDGDHSMCDRCWYVRKYGKPSDVVTDDVSDTSVTRPYPNRTEPNRREVR